MLVNLVNNLPINDLLQCFNLDLILFSFGIQVIHDHLGERTLSPVQFVDEKSLNCSVKLLLNMSLQIFFVVNLFSQQFVNFMIKERCCVVVLVQLLLQLTFNIFVQNVVLVGWKKVFYLWWFINQDFVTISIHNFLHGKLEPLLISLLRELICLAKAFFAILVYQLQLD